MRIVPIKAFFIIYLENVKETVILSCISLGIVKAAGLSCRVRSRREVHGESEGRRLVDSWGFHTVWREVDNLSLFPSMRLRFYCRTYFGTLPRFPERDADSSISVLLPLTTTCA